MAGPSQEHPLVAARKMQVGYNYPWAWNQYGTYFGSPSDRWLEQIVWDMRNLATMGITHMRIFLLCNGWKVGRLTRTAGVPVAINIPAVDTYVYDPPTNEDPLFARQLKRLLEEARTQGMQLLLSFLCFGAFSPVPCPGAGGRSEIATNLHKGKLFLDNVLDPLLKTAKDFKDINDIIYAWEVINEPSWSGWRSILNGNV